jgi:hypothetical protein
VRWRSYEGNTKGPSGGYGIQTGEFNGIFVLDLDRRAATGDKPAKDGVGELLRLSAGRPIPDTSSVLTPSGGVHLYFRLPAGAHVPTSHGVLAPGVDVKGEGGFVVGPGSPHKNGGTYQEVPGPLADPPAWLLELVSREPPAPRPLESAHRTVEPTSPEGVRAVAWAKGYLSGAEPAIEGQGGSDRLFAACCHLMYSALPLDVLRQLVLEIYNPRCEPPWSPEEIAHKLVDADRVFEPPRGLCSPGFFDRLRGRATDTTTTKSPDPLHEYTFSVGMRSGADLCKATFGEVASDLYDHVDWAGVLSFNTFRNRIVAVDPPMKMDAETPSGLSDNDVQLVRAWLEYHGEKCSTQDVTAAVETVAPHPGLAPVAAVGRCESPRPRAARVFPVRGRCLRARHRSAVVHLARRARDDARLPERLHAHTRGRPGHRQVERVPVAHARLDLVCRELVRRRQQGLLPEPAGRLADELR